MTRRRFGLTAQLVGSHLLVIAIATGISTFGLLSLARQYFVNADRQSLLVQARLLAKSCDQTCLDRRLSTADISAAQLPAASNAVQSQVDNRNRSRVVVPDRSAGTDSSVSLGGSDGQTNVRTALTSVVRIVRLGDAEPGASVLEALAGTDSARRVGQLLIAAAPVRRNGQVAGAVLVTQELSDSRAIIDDLRRRSVFAGAVAAAIAALFALLRARTITRPVKRLQLAAHSMADGDFSTVSTASLRRGGTAEIADLTESFETMRTQVQRQLALRNEFLANASHELRTPLTALKGYIDLLADGAAERPDVRTRFLASMGGETNRLIRLVDDLLTLSRSDAGALSLRRTPVRWSAMVRGVVESIRPNPRHTLDVTGPDDQRTVEIDVDRIEQVLLNLIANAFAHTQSYVNVVLQTEPGVVSVAVIDDGPGIATTDRDRIFDRFVRLDAARARTAGTSESGAGLGLAISRSLVEAHGGTLTCESTDGPGARFVLRLPLVREPG